VGGLDNSKILDLLQMVEARLSTCYWRFNAREGDIKKKRASKRRKKEPV